MIKTIQKFLKGMAVGVANIIPGVSGGTLALILNIYEPLIEAIHNISASTFISFFKLFTFKKENVENFKAEMKKINFSLLFWVIAGAGAAILAFSGLMTYLIQNYQPQTYGFFFGLIIVSIAVPYMMIKKMNWKVVLAIVVAIACIVGLSMLETDEAKIEKEELSISLDEGEALGYENGILDYAYLALCGGVSMCTMIVPGVSGSFILLLMGQYFTVLEAISNLDIAVIIVFGIGAVLGLLIFSRFLNFLLHKFHDVTMGFLTGLVIGSLWAIWPFKELYTLSNGETITLSNIMPSSFDSTVLITMLMVLVGGAIVFSMIRIEAANEKKKN